MVIRLLAILAAAVIVCVLAGCSTEPEIEIPGKTVDTAETMPGGWMPVSTWTLSEVAPGIWFTLNTAMYGDIGGNSQQFVNAITADGKPIKFRCDGRSTSFKAVLTTLDGSIAPAILTMFTKSNGGVSYVRYELRYPLAGPR